jgi:hypothetical protein
MNDRIHAHHDGELPPFLFTTPMLRAAFGVPEKTIRGYVAQGWLLSEKRLHRGQDINLIDRFQFEDFLAGPRAGQYRRSPVNIPLGKIRIDPALQSRAEMNRAAISDYSAEVKSGHILEPIALYGNEPDGYHCGDGFHRYAAAMLAGLTALPAYCWPGGADAAFERSLRSNHLHGVRRTNADKRRCVVNALSFYAKFDLSNNRIAEICGVSDMMVAAVKRDIARAPEIEFRRDGKAEILPRLMMREISRLSEYRARRTAKIAKLECGSVNPIAEIEAAADLLCALAGELQAITGCAESKVVAVARRLVAQSTDQAAHLDQAVAAIA